MYRDSGVGGDSFRFTNSKQSSAPARVEAGRAGESRRGLRSIFTFGRRGLSGGRTALPSSLQEGTLMSKVNSSPVEREVGRLMSRPRALWALASCLLLLLALPAYAQKTSGQITGSVVDEKGAAIPDTTVVITQDRKSTRLNSSHTVISYAVFCLK